MAMFPTNISTSSLILKEKGNKVQISCSYEAQFEGGNMKVLNRVYWTLKSLIKSSDLEWIHLSKSECTLYYADWQNVKSFKNNWNECYPV